jgi:hypothetical protein
MKMAGNFNYDMQYESSDLTTLNAVLMSKRGFLLGLLENPNLLEHETFTKLLWAVFHLTEELAVRDDLQNLSHADGYHVAGDIRQVYTILIVEWLVYMKHLKRDYPYLFSFAVRTNPFDSIAQMQIR